MRFKGSGLCRRSSAVLLLMAIVTCAIVANTAVVNAYGDQHSSNDPDTKKLSSQQQASAAATQQQHFEPQVAIFCPPQPKHPVSEDGFPQQPTDDDIFSSSSTGNSNNLRRKKPNYPQYITQYLTKSGEWLPDLSRKTTCTRDKLEILRHCQRLYPDRDITNIVESNRPVKIGNLCKISGGNSALSSNTNNNNNNAAAVAANPVAGATNTAGMKVKCVGRDENRNGISVTPYRCLESPFQSDALLVPSPCIFDHIHNASTCLETSAWNQTAKKSCDARSMELKSYAILLPCGVGLFAGVEFVCCPIDKGTVHTPPKNSFSHDLGVFSSGSNNAKDELDDDDDEDDDEDQDDEYDEDDYDDDYLDDNSDTTKKKFGSTGGKFGEVPVMTTSTTTSTTTTTTTTTTTPPPPPPPPLIDPYFRRFDTYNEHSNYKSALHRLESLHRSRMQKVTHDWNEMESKYQQMRGNGMTKEAEEFKHTITLRFQKTIRSLEEEGQAEKRQLIAVHQQRVLAHINERKKESMECYTQALNERPQNVNKIRKCVEKLMRVLHKDRHHTLAHYKHLLKSGGGGGVEEEYTLQRLVGISATARSCLQMLNRYGNLADELKPLIEDYVLSLQGRDDPPGSLLTATRDTEQLLLQKYRSQVIRKYPQSGADNTQQQQQFLNDDLEEPEDLPTPVPSLLLRASSTESPLLMMSSSTSFYSSTTGMPGTVSGGTGPTPTTTQQQPQHDQQLVDDDSVDDYVGGEKDADGGDAGNNNNIHGDQDDQSNRVVAHALVRNEHAEAGKKIGGEPKFDQTFTVRREVYHYRENKSVYFTMAFAGIAIVGAMVIGLVVLRRRANSPRNQGFLEVNTNIGFTSNAITPEEKHVANMQINGYENPTYKYFETTANT